ncbi:MAG TPA: GGDEF domain-containing protein, partial [Xanthobacteraceae bacterium]|nr:GGDEF domain-containing protein [Xanthobacteraceae bacterium]
MSQQGPILVVSNAGRPAFASVLDEAGMFPVVDAGWADASRAINQLQPAAVVAAATGAVEPRFAALAKQIAAQNPYLPLVAVDPKGRLPENAIPFSQNDGNFGRLVARLNATLRMRTLHATVMRRQDEDRLDP